MTDDKQAKNAASEGTSASPCSAHSGFEEWWQATMQGRMPGSKYLARKAWSAALMYSVEHLIKRNISPNAESEVSE